MVGGHMNIRKRCLPVGWYPSNQQATLAKIEKMAKGLSVSSINAVAGIVPHAGWDFSGQIALEVFASFQGKPDTVVIVGGHLSKGSGVYAAFEQGFATPLGIVDADLELLAELKQEISIKEDITPDNTVEIQLPLVEYYFPKAKALWLRAAPSAEALDLSKALFKAGKTLKRELVVIGSTDLTHYGFNYGFMPMGGAVAAAGFALENGLKKGKLLRYLTSWDIYPSDSFVGYVGIIYGKG